MHTFFFNDQGQCIHFVYFSHVNESCYLCQRHKNGTTTLDQTTDDVDSARALCASLSASEEPLPATELSLRAHHFEPYV